MDLHEYLSAKRGRQLYVAKQIGIAPSYMHQIYKGLRPVPVELGALIEKATNGEVTRKELFPETWDLIWPELLHPENYNEVKT